MNVIENRTFDELEIGESAQIVRPLLQEDIALFAAMSGDVNPAHMDEAFAKDAIFHKVIGHGMWGGAIISAVLGTQLPGPGTIYVNQSLKFLRPVGIGDTITTRVTVAEKRARGHVVLDCECTNQNGEAVISGTAEVIAPKNKIRRARIAAPNVAIYQRGAHYAAMLALSKEYAPLKTVVVHPVDSAALLGALEARDAGLIDPILVGPLHRIEAAATAANVDISGIETVGVEHSHAAAREAVRLVRAGRAEALMKGSLHTDELLGAVVAENGLRTARRMSHVFALDVPSYYKPLFITDAAINIYPSLEDKRDIVQNAIDLCRILDIARPKVAILSAVETVDPKITSTLEAAALCKMAERGQITGGLLDGPLAFDNAISKAAAEMKHIVSPVAGDADILVAPDLEAGNMIAKQLIYLAGAEAAGIVLGARAPIILTSRSDGPTARAASAALALLAARRSKELKV
jgi:phosphate acetyltransferase